MAGKGVEAPRPELVELIKGSNVHGKRVYGHVHAVDVWYGDGVVCQCLCHVLGHHLLEVVVVGKIVLLCLCVCVFVSFPLWMRMVCAKRQTNLACQQVAPQPSQV